MKRLLLFFVFCPLLGNAQTKFDYNWIFGYPSDINFPPFYLQNGSQIDFNSAPESYKYFDIPVDMDANAVVSDSLGNLLFYSNGCVIVNSQHTIMNNGADINQGGITYEQSCISSIGYPFGYPSHQGALALPFPGKANHYILLHLHRPGEEKLIEELLYTTVDMTQDAGFGAVIAKNLLAFRDTMVDMLTAIRHANGRDWWVVLPKLNSSTYYVFLLSPAGISAPLVQHDLGIPIVVWSWGIQATHSPNGKKYANLSSGAGLQVFDFDRCTGRLSVPIHVPFPNDVFFAAGIAFSPNSRYLYASVTDHLYQFDFKTPDFLQSKMLIGKYDGFVDPEETTTPVNFYQMMATPDGRIFMTCANGSRYLHVIHQPNEKGVACNFEQHSIKLPTFHAFSTPNFPHFRLFDVPGSACDTLGINGIQPPEDTLVPPEPPLPCVGSIRLHPNPATLMTTLELPQCQGGTLSVYDVAGRKVQMMPLTAGVVSVPLDVSSYVSGLYLLRIRTADGEVVTRSLAVVRP